MLMRIALLFSLSWIVRLTEPLFSVLGQEISGRDLVLLIGGLFLIGKAPTRSTSGSRARKARRRPGWPPRSAAC